METKQCDKRKINTGLIPIRTHQNSAVDVKRQRFAVAAFITAVLAACFSRPRVANIASEELKVLELFEFSFLKMWMWMYHHVSLIHYQFVLWLLKGADSSKDCLKRILIIKMLLCTL